MCAHLCHEETQSNMAHMYTSVLNSLWKSFKALMMNLPRVINLEKVIVTLSSISIGAFIFKQP